MKQRRFLGVLAGLAIALLVNAAPAFAADYDTVLTQLGELQQLATDYTAQQGSGDAIVLTLSYTRTGSYNTSIWQMTAGTRDPGFESYVAEKNGDLSDLQGLSSVTLPNGQAIDFGHLLASMNLVYNGIPITGSWGGDCMELAQAYAGQASDAASYQKLMAATFAIPDDGSTSTFGDQDLRADLDSVNVGAQLKADTSIADTLRTYYTSLDDATRCYDFIARSFGTVDTGKTDTFRETVYSTMVNDAGMQLLLYINGLWGQSGDWTISASAEPAMRGAAYSFADYLATAVGNEKVKSDSSTLMVTMAGPALTDALSALGYQDAASAASSYYASSGAQSTSTATVSGSNVSEAVSSALTGATQTIKGAFNLDVFRLVLCVLGGAALLLLLGCVVMLLRHR